MAPAFRPGYVSASVAIALALVLAACGRPPEGVDRDLVGEWAAMPEPEPIRPEAGVCLDAIYKAQPSLRSSYYGQVACTEPHQIETVHVGAFEGEAAEREGPPNPGSAEWRTAYEECDSAAADYLGADFRYGRLWLGVAVPLDLAWDGGARWFRCDVLQVDRHDNFVSSMESWRDVLAGESELSLGCFTTETSEVAGSDDSTIDEMAEVACEKPHHAEFVGVWRVPPSRLYPGRPGASSSSVIDGCREQVAEYVDVPADGNLQYRTGVATWLMSQEDWQNGDRGVRCYLWLPDGVSRSLEGAGTDGLPIPGSS